MVYAGYHDLKKIEFNILVLPPLLVVPLFLYYEFWGLGLFPVLAIAVNAVFIALVVMGRIGLMDIAVSVRVPLIFPLMTILNPAAVLSGFVLGVAASYVYYVYRYIKPILCPGAKIFSAVTMVRKDAIGLNYVMPPNVPMDIDPVKLSRIKEKMLKSKTECVEAVVGIPYLFIFCIGYALAMLLGVSTMLL